MTVAKIGEGPVKRFLVYYGHDYYPMPAVGDLQLSADTLEEAVAAAKVLSAKDDGFSMTWWEIVDHSTMTKVAEGESK
jgi:hypothetical protein